jgi:hypothetical protein
MKLFNLGKPRLKKIQDQCRQIYKQQNETKVRPKLKPPGQWNKENGKVRPKLKPPGQWNKENGTVEDQIRLRCGNAEGTKARIELGGGESFEGFGHVDIQKEGGTEKIIEKQPAVLVVDDDPLPHAAIIGDFGCLVDVPADGNCGFAALIWGLHHDLQLESNWEIANFRKAIKDHAVTNEDELFGMSFYRLGCNRRQKKEQDIFEKEVWRKSLRTLFTSDEAYKGGAPVSGWLDGAKHFPIIADRFKVNIVVYVLEEIFPYTDIYKIKKNNDGGREGVERQTIFSSLRPPASDGLDKSRTVYLVLADKHYQYLSVGRLLV